MSAQSQCGTRTGHRSHALAHKPQIRNPPTWNATAVITKLVPLGRYHRIRCPPSWILHPPARRRLLKPTQAFFKRTASTSGDSDIEAAPPPAEEPSTTPAAAATAAAGSEATAQHQPGQVSGLTLVKDALRLLWDFFWPVVLIYAACDVAVFVLHRLSHRVLNEVALRVLGDVISEDMVGNLWWISSNPAVANFETGYQWLVCVLFVLALPIHILLRSVAATTSVLVCSQGTPSGGHPWQNVVGSLRAGWAGVRAVGPQVREAWARVALVDLLVALRVLPLQAASLLLLPLFWTVPRILDMQLSAPVAVLEGAPDDMAIQRSRRLMRPMRRALLWPWVGLLAAVKGLEPLKSYVLTTVPPRYYSELPEIPILAIAILTLASLVVARMQDLLPLAAYRQACMMSDNEA